MLFIRVGMIGIKVIIDSIRGWDGVVEGEEGIVYIGVVVVVDCH